MAATKRKYKPQDADAVHFHKPWDDRASRTACKRLRQAALLTEDEDGPITCPACFAWVAAARHNRTNGLGQRRKVDKRRIDRRARDIFKELGL